MKLTDATGSSERTTATIDLGLRGLSPRMKEEIREQVGEYLVEQILLNVGEAKSPVAGESFPALSKEYKDRKIELGGVGKPNMELNGPMLSSLTFKPTEDGIELGFFDEQAAKADGHLKFSGKENNNPKRRFIPGEGQLFKAQIQKEVDRIVAEKVLGQFRESDFKEVYTSAVLYRKLADILPGKSQAQIRDFVLGSTKLVGILDDLGILGLL